MVAAIFFAIQIYGDFSGYSDIAIGTSRLFGIRLMRNFNYPYFSRDIAEFWRRWHISLTTWFRDYVYIPLGGSRVSKAKIIRNTFIIFLVSGFWHGANWTFIAWGAFHALLFMPLILTGSNRKYLNEVAHNRILPTLSEFGSICLTFFFAVIGWILFRAVTITDALQYMYRMVDPQAWGMLAGKLEILLCGLMTVIMFVFEWFNRTEQHGLACLGKSRCVRWIVYLSLLFAIWLFRGVSSTFIYFQF